MKEKKHFLLPIYKQTRPKGFYRKELICDCSNTYIEEIERNVCCMPTTKTATTILSKSYGNSQYNYLRQRKLRYEDNLDENCKCDTLYGIQKNNTIIRKNNTAFYTQGAVDSSAKIWAMKYNAIPNARIR